MKRNGTCKTCGKQTEIEYYKKECKECTKKRLKECSKRSQITNEYLKEKIKTDKGTITKHKETKEDYEYWGIGPPIVPTTKKPCSTCKERHEKEKQYNHKYTKEIKIPALPIETIKLILKNKCKRNCKTKIEKYLTEMRITEC